jgi:RNA polymerase sigma factor (sigma-70 family)
MNTSPPTAPRSRRRQTAGTPPGGAPADAPVGRTTGTGQAARQRAAPRRPPGAGKPPFEQVVAEHGAVVLRVVRAVLGPADAEDAWSETFVAALKAYPELAPDANVQAWLVTIAHRKAMDAHRGNARRPTPVGELPDRPSPTGRPQDWDADLWRVLRELPERQRHAVAYHYLAGLPYKEVAAVMGGSTDAARRAAADGIRALRRTYPGGTETKDRSTQ